MTVLDGSSEADANAAPRSRKDVKEMIFHICKSRKSWTVSRKGSDEKEAVYRGERTHKIMSAFRAKEYTDTRELTKELWVAINR